jgi:hypothetical protein
MSQFIKPQIKWTPEKIAKLKSEYPLGDKKALAKEFGITQEALKSAAPRFGVKSEKDQRKYKLKPLYEESCLAYYWMGFIMADGHLDIEGELHVNLSIKDEEHLKKLADLLCVNIGYFKSFCMLQSGEKSRELDYVRLGAKDCHYGILLREKFGLSPLPKTYNPPNLEIKNNSFFLSFFLGLIDGDGTFSKRNGDCNFIRLEMHSSWYPILKDISYRLKSFGINSTVTGINNNNYAFLKIYRHQNLVALKTFSIDKNLPKLERKWNSVNLDKIVNYTKKNEVTLNREDLLNV